MDNVPQLRGCNIIPENSGGNQFSCLRSVDPIQLVDYGLQCSFNHLDFGYRSCRRCYRKAVDAGEGSRRLHRNDSAWYCWRVRGDLDRSYFCGRELRRRLDHVDCRRNDPIAPVSIVFQARRIAHACGRACVKHRTNEQAFDTNASTAVSNATFGRGGVAMFAPSRECEMVIASWPRRQERE